MKEQQPFIVDAHLDLSMNAMEWNRDLRWTVAEIRAHERHMTDKPGRGNNTVSFNALREGNIGLIVGTQLARYTRKSNQMPGASWNSAEQAWAQTQAQLAWYREMVSCGELRQITDSAQLKSHLSEWEENPDECPIGMVRSLEGADSLVSLEHLDRAYEDGLRIIGPAHYGPGTYAFGTDSDGGVGELGRQLLRRMDELKMIMDATHLCDRSFREAMDTFNGPVWASHSNCRALVPHNRQFSDEQLKELIERGAVIGAAMDAWMLTTTWERGVSTPQSTGVTLENVVDHIDHVCQLAGNAQHAAIGSDLDGAYGREQSPSDIDTIADLQKIPAILADRGYTPDDIENIMSRNWIRFLEAALAVNR